MTASEALRELAVAVNHTGYDAVVEALYVREIGGYDSRDVQAACQRLGRTSQWWPKLVELRTAVHEARDTRQKLTRGADDPDRTFRCLRCHDARWRILDCPGGDRRVCGRPAKGGMRTYISATDGKARDAYVASCKEPHTYAVRCSCHDAAGAPLWAPKQIGA